MVVILISSSHLETWKLIDLAQMRDILSSVRVMNILYFILRREFPITSLVWRLHCRIILIQEWFWCQLCSFLLFIILIVNHFVSIIQDCFLILLEKWSCSTSLIIMAVIIIGCMKKSRTHNIWRQKSYMICIKWSSWLKLTISSAFEIIAVSFTIWSNLVVN